jgi:hypothetical protein
VEQFQLRLLAVVKAVALEHLVDLEVVDKVTEVLNLEELELPIKEDLEELGLEEIFIVLAVAAVAVLTLEELE